MKNCISCQHAIDESAKLCPYCGADPETGEKIDVKPLVEAHFPPKPELAPTATVMSFLRQRQGIVVTAIIIGSFLLLTALHQLISRRNQQEANDVPAIPLTEVADLSRQSEKSAELPIPDVDFTYEGNARTMQTFLVEPGAVAPKTPIQPPAQRQSNVAETPPQQQVAPIRIAPSNTQQGRAFGESREPYPASATAPQASTLPPTTTSPQQPVRTETIEEHPGYGEPEEEEEENDGNGGR